MNAIAADKVLVELQAKVANYNRDVNNASRNFDLRMRQVGNSARVAERNVKASTDAMSAQVTSLSRTFTMALAGGIFAGGAAGLIRAVRGVTREMSDLANAAKMVGIGTEDLQRLRFGLEQTGVSANTTDTAMRRFARRIGEAANGGGQLYEVLKANNVQLRNQDGSMRSQVDLLRDYANLIRNAGSHQERLSLAFKAFDVAGSEMVQGLMEDFDDLMGKVEDVGGVIDDELIQRAAEMDTEFANLWRNFEVWGKSAIISVAATLRDGLLKDINAIGSALRDLINDPSLHNAGRVLFGDDYMAEDPVRVFQDRVNFLTQHVEALKAKGEDALEAERQLAIATAALEQEVNRIVAGGGGSGEITLPPISVTATPTIIPSGGSGSGSKRGSRNAEAAAALREAEAVVKLIEGLEHELAIMGKTEVEKAKANALRQAGAAATAEQKEEIERLIEAIHREQEAIKSAEEMARFFQSTMENAFMSVIPVIETGNDALDNLLNTLIKVVAQAALFGSGPLGGMFGGGKGLLGGLFSSGFSTGGYTGPGPKNKPAGVVHAGEVVWSQDDIRKAGGVAAVEAMRKGAGSVAMPSFSAPTMPKMAAGGASGQQIIVHFAPQIDASGADAAAIQRLEGGLQKLKAEIPAQVIQGVRKAQQSNVKLG